MPSLLSSLELPPPTPSPRASAELISHCFPLETPPQPWDRRSTPEPQPVKDLTLLADQAAWTWAQLAAVSKLEATAAKATTADKMHWVAAQMAQHAQAHLPAAFPARLNAATDVWTPTAFVATMVPSAHLM